MQKNNFRRFAPKIFLRAGWTKKSIGKFFQAQLHGGSKGVQDWAVTASEPSQSRPQNLPASPGHKLAGKLAGKTGGHRKNGNFCGKTADIVPLIYAYPCYHFFRSFWTFYNAMALSFCKGDQKTVNFLGKAGKIGGVTPRLSLATSCLGLVTPGGVLACHASSSSMCIL